MPGRDELRPGGRRTRQLPSLLTAAEVGSLVKLTRQQVTALARQGWLPGHRPPGPHTRWHFAAEDVAKAFRLSVAALRRRWNKGQFA